MDILTVSHTGMFSGLLESLKIAEAEGQCRKGEPISEERSRTTIITEFHEDVVYIHQDDENEKPDDKLCVGIISMSYPPSTKSSDDLKKIMLKDLRISTRHEGKFAVLRTVTVAFQRSCIMVIAEDENDQVIQVIICQQEIEKDKNITAIAWPLHTVIYLKEPNVQLKGDGRCCIRVDHVSDFRRLYPHDKEYPVRWRPKDFDADHSAMIWKWKGNDAVEKADYNRAIFCYTHALECQRDGEDDDLIKMNLALVYLYCKRFEDVVPLLKDMVALREPPVEALLRQAEALCHLGKYIECARTIEKVTNIYPEDLRGRKEVLRVSRILKEWMGGCYDWVGMQLKATTVERPILDHATHIGPVEGRRSVLHHGNGLFTTKDVKVGELLFCEKAFAYGWESYKNDECASNNIVLAAEINSAVSGTSGEVIRAAIQKCEKNPTFAKEFKKIYHGAYKSVDIAEVDGRPVVDTFLIHRIVALNAIGQVAVSPLLPHGRACATGIWPTATLINHSCTGNAWRAILGDMLIARATCDMPADTEIVWTYHQTPYEDRLSRADYKTHWGFECTCVVCTEEAMLGDGMLKARTNATIDVSRLIELSAETKSDTQARLLKKALVTLEETYKQCPREIPRTPIADGYMELLRLSGERRNFKTVIFCALKALEALGFVITGCKIPFVEDEKFVIHKWGVYDLMLPELFTKLASALKHCGAPELYDDVFDYGKTAYNICMGQGTTFEITQNMLCRHEDNGTVCTAVSKAQFCCHCHLPNKP